MKRNGSNRGAVLIWVLGLIVISGILLNVLASHACRAADSSRRMTEAEAALFEARGGVRWAAARLGEMPPVGTLVRDDGDGSLRVEIEGDLIRATYAWKEGRARSVSARWRRAGAVELFEWREE